MIAFGKEKIMKNQLEKLELKTFFPKFSEKDHHKLKLQNKTIFRKKI